MDSAPAPAILIDSVTIDPVALTVRPLHPDGDDHFGLGPFSNGTAPAHRRLIAAPAHYRWVRFNGSRATGPLYVAGKNQFRNEWAGE